jgi:hypothetical protein
VEDSVLKTEFGEILLEYNFLSSPNKLIKYQSQYFEKDLIKIDIMKIKEISENNNHIYMGKFKLVYICVSKPRP